MSNAGDVRNIVLRLDKYEDIVVKIDMTSCMVLVYKELVVISNSICNSIILPFTGYNKIRDTFKIWKHQPTQFKSECRNRVSLFFMANIFILILLVVLNRRLSKSRILVRKATSLIIPPVLLRDEIKTDSYSMAIIELLCVSGIVCKV